MADVVEMQARPRPGAAPREAVGPRGAGRDAQPGGARFTLDAPEATPAASPLPPQADPARAVPETPSVSGAGPRDTLAWLDLSGDAGRSGAEPWTVPATPADASNAVAVDAEATPPSAAPRSGGSDAADTLARPDSPPAATMRGDAPGGGAPVSSRRPEGLPGAAGSPPPAPAGRSAGGQASARLRSGRDPQAPPVVPQTEAAASEASAAQGPPGFPIVEVAPGEEPPEPAEEAAGGGAGMPVTPPSPAPVLVPPATSSPSPPSPVPAPPMAVGTGAPDEGTLRTAGPAGAVPRPGGASEPAGSEAAGSEPAHVLAGAGDAEASASFAAQLGAPAGGAHSAPAAAIAEPKAAAPAQASAPGQGAPPPVPLGAVPMTIGLRALGASSRFEIRLDPLELGRIEVALDIDRERGTVEARFVVDRPETLALLQRDASSLQQALSQAGLDAGEGIDLSLRPGQGDDARAGAGQGGRDGEAGGRARLPGRGDQADPDPSRDRTALGRMALTALRGLGRIDIRI